MIKTWRWYGPHDSVSFDDIKQSGVTEIVTSLHDKPYGALWTKEAIKKRQSLLKENGLNWLVVESIPVHEDIKTRTGNFKEYIKNYKQSIENLAACRIRIVCYNFMPIMDWTRTNLYYRLENGATTVKFEFIALAAFDLFILKRKNAEADYTKEEISSAEKYFSSLDAERTETLIQTLIANLPGTDKKYTLDEFREVLLKYRNIDENTLKEHLFLFLKEIIPVAERTGVRMCIHPDDPPFTLLGLPRIVSTINDISDIINAVDSPVNGLTYCTGSLGVRKDNDLSKIFTKFSNKVHFIHLRSTLRDEKKNFFEATHIDGDVDMYQIIKLILLEQKRRKELGRKDAAIPMRPDHGHQMMDDLNKKFYPGYSCIGRMKGLAELRGMEMGILKSLTFYD